MPHYVFSGFTLILCLPDFKNNLVQPQSIRLLHLYLLFCLCPPTFDFLLHCGPSKKLDCTISVVLAGVVSVFVSHDWSVCVCVRVCVLSSRNLGQRERAYVEGQMKTLDEGLQLKQQLIEEGVLLWREKQVHRPASEAVLQYLCHVPVVNKTVTLSCVSF